jgi:twitching motility protein PilT
VARIDRLIKSMTRLGASGMTLRSDENIVLNFADGDRHAAQKIPHGDLVDLVLEIASPAASAALFVEQPGAFEHACDDERYEVSVTPGGHRWVVVFLPAAAARPAPVAPPARPAAPERRREAVAEVAPAPATPSPIVGNEYADNFAVKLSDPSENLGESAAAPLALESHRLAEPAPRPAASETLPPPPPVAPLPSSPPAAAVARVVPARVPVAEARSPAPAPLGAAATGFIPTLLRRMAELKASDLHLTAGSPPFMRVHGEMAAQTEFPTLDADGLQVAIDEISPERNREEFAQRNDTDFAYEIPGLSRYRVNVFRDRMGPGTVIRAIPFQILTPEQLGLPKEVLKLCYLSKGLVLVTGPTGSGKSTTLATLVDHVNDHRSDHIITIEDPIEFVHHNKKCLVNQREVHCHTDSFKDALRAALREDPDIVLVGEMRDLETIAIAVETAETGHLVFGTLHTTTAPSTVDRIIDQFPADRQEQIRQMLAESLRGVISQNLCRKIGGGRIAAYEVLMCNKAVANLIRERKTFQLFSLMQTGKAQGMRTLTDTLVEYVVKGLVEPMEAYIKAADKAEILRSFQRANIDFKLGEGQAAE